MAVNDFVRRSIQIVGGGIAQSTTDYFDNAISFVNDVKEVIDMGKQMGSDGAKKFNELKSSGILKKTRDWFYNEGGMFGDFDFDDEEFDAGFEIESADSEDNAESSKPLSKDMMTDIAKKQTGAMYKAFGRQADLQIANTAEIISTINTRTAELTASVNNVNNTLIQIGKRLDLIVEWTSARTKKEEEEKRQAGILDYGGGISLTGVVNKAKENAEDSMLGTFMSIGKTMLGSGMMTPEMVMSMILSQTILDKKWDKLGKKSINDIGEFINDTVDEVIQNTMTRILTTKNEMLSSLFEDIITKAGGKNYQNSVVNQYNDKPAVFDGMTRKSIVTVIPGYLNEILKAVSKDGMGREIDKKGNLTKKKTNSFINEISDNYFRAGMVGYRERDEAEKRLKSKLSGRDINTAIRALSGTWAYYMYRRGITILEVGEVTDFNAPSTRWVVETTAELLASKKSEGGQYSVDEWMNFLHVIINEIDEFKFRKELQRNADRADKAFEDFAKHHVNAHQAKTIDYGMLLQAWDKNYSDFNKDLDTQSNTSAVNPTQIGSNQTSTSITTQDIAAGIFQRLNEGINVFVTGKKNLRKIPYAPIKLRAGFAKDLLNMSPVQQASAAVEATKNNVTAAANAANKVVDVAIGSPKKEHPPEIQEILDKPEEERTKEEQRTLSKYMKDEKKGIVKKIAGGFGNGVKKLAGTDRHMGIVDQDTMEVGEWLSNKIGGFLDKVAPNRKKQIVESEAYKTISESKAAEKVKAGANKAANFAGDLLLGKQETNEAGEIVRNGGVLHTVAKPLASLGNTAGNVSAKLMSKKRLNEKVNNIFDKYKEGGTHAPGGEQFNAGSNDYMNIQIIQSMADAAMSNGKFDQIDKQNLLKQISALDDKDTQKRLKQYLIPLMERNSKSDDKPGKGGGEQKSPFGKLGGMILGAAKLAFGGIFVYVRTVIKAVFGIIKYGLKGIFKFAKWGITRGLRQIKYGAKSFASGAKQVTKSIAKSISKGISPVINNISKVFEGIKGGVTKVFSGLSEKFSKWKESREEKKESQPEAGEKKSITEKLGDKISGAKSKLIDKLGGNGNGFMGGFFSARNERKAAEAKAKADAESKPMRDAMEQTGIPEIKTAAEEVADVLKDESDSGKGFMKPVIKMLKDLIGKKEEETTGSTEEISEGGSEGKSETPQMENIEAPQSGSQMQSVDGASSTDLGGNSRSGGSSSTPAPDAGDAGSGGDEEGGGLKNGIGKMLGGMSSMMGGLLNIVISIVMSLEGFKLMIDTVMEILKSSLEPLNEAFQAITKALKPILKQLGGIIKQLAEFIVVIVDAVVDVIKPIISDVVQPVLEVVAPLLQSIIGCLTPLLKIVGILLKVIMAPLMGLFKFVLLPILKIIGDAVQIIMGVLQIGFGLIMICLGGIIGAIGKVISCIPGAGGKGKDLAKSGGDMLDQGKDFVAQGMKSVAQGIVNIVLDYASLYSLGASDALLGRGEEKDKKETKKIEPADDNTVQNTYVNGDANNYYGSSDIYNTYGGEYQRGMGGYLNMDQRGCGPIALADMYNRNQSGRVNARSLAGSMFNNGTYDPRRGTSVGGYIDSARSLGMNLTPGKVTQQTLKSASPTHPITVVGSGSDYGTRNGNNHFMNVIGTDRHGGAYVSNPLTGRIDRRPASTVAGSAVLGLYAGGDADGGYSFPDAIKSAFQKLKDEAAKILGLFNMEKSEEEETEELINGEQKKAAVEQAKKDLGDEYAQYEEKAKAVALEDFKKRYPQKDNESDDDYQAAFDKWWEGTADQAKYLAEAGVLDNALEAAKKKNSTVWNELKEGTDNFQKNMLSSLESIKNSNNEGHGSSVDGSGYFSTESGKSKLALGNPTFSDVDMTINDGGHYKHAPLLEFFKNTAGADAFLYGNNFYNQYGTDSDHTKEGVGTAGSTHQGIDLHWEGESDGKIPIYAPTDGVLELAQPEARAAGGGNYVSMIDNDGNRHRFMHMNKFSDEIKNMGSGGTIVGGKTILGYEGYTGNVEPPGPAGLHTHYDIYLNGGSGAHVNPLTYFSKFTPAAGVALGDTDEEKVYSYLITSGMSPIGAAGLMGCFKYESGFKTNNLEDKFEGIFGTNDAEYTRNVDNGTETEDQFVNSRGYGTSGYGIAQFTSANLKQRLYDDTVKQGRSIASLEPQLDGVISVLKERGIYDTINNAKTPTDANKTFLWKYEAGNNYSSDEAVIADYPWFLNSDPNGAILRHQYAEAVYDRFKDWSPQKASNGFTDSNGNVRINSASDEKQYWNLQDTGSTSGKGRGIVITQSDQLNVRKEKSINSDILDHLDSGTEIDIESCGSRDWLYVPSLGGYVSSQFVKILTSDNDDKDWASEHVNVSDASQTLKAKNAVTEYANLSVGLNADGSTPKKEQPKKPKQTLPIDNKPSWYNFASWFSEDQREKRTDFYKTAAENHKKAMQKKTKNGGVAFGEDKRDIEAYLDKYGTAQVSRGASKKWAGDEQYYQYQYANAKDKTRGGDLIDYTTFPVYKQLQELGKIYGAGDVDSMLTEDEFWNNYLGWNNKYNSNVSIPMSDGSDTAYSSDTYYDPETGTTVVNNYAVTRAEDKATDARLKAVLANTYNVRSETMEALLNAILEELKKRRDPRGGGNNTNGSTKLFDERIPSQVTRLSVG